MIKDYKLWENEMPLYEADKPCENKLVAYLHEDGEPHPAVIVYPGGGYQCYGDTEQHTIAQYYYDHGYQAFIAYYRLTPYHHPAPLLDAQRAVKLVRYRAAEWHIDPDRVFTVGFSAGGHLNGCVATQPDVCTVLGDEVDAMDARPTGALLSYPVISADPAIAHVGTFHNLLGDEEVQLRHTLSLEHCVGEDTCPCFVWHTLYDSCVPMEHSLRFTEAMKRHRRPVELHIFSVADHGKGLAEEYPGTCQWSALSLDWMERVLRAEI